MKIITADERAKEKRGFKLVIAGESGIGKTSLAKTLDPKTTLFMDLEAGDAAIEGEPIDVRPSTWQDCRDFATFLGGFNPSLSEDSAYSEAHYNYVCSVYGDPNEMLDKYDTIFIDSITVAGRLCFGWCSNQPENRSDRTGKLDTRAVYGMHGIEMMKWLTHLQHIRSKNVVFVGILDKKIDEYGRTNFELQIEGSKTGRELPGIVDEVITMASLTSDDGKQFRAFICHTMNQWGYPAKDRSGKLNLLEEPNLQKLFAKMSTVSTERDMEFVDPNNVKLVGEANA
jgi:hypothetical protein